MAPRCLLGAAILLKTCAVGNSSIQLGERGGRGPGDLLALLQRSISSGGSEREKSALATQVRTAPVVEGPPPLYLPGDGAEVFIETGKYENSWVPCTVLKMKGPGWYDIKLMAGKRKGQNTTTVQAVKYNYMRQVPIKEYQEKFAAFMENPEKDGLALQVEREAGRRKRASEAAKKSREYAKTVMAKGCPGEYIITEGNFPGPDQFGRGGGKNMKPSAEQCSQDCDKHEGCKAFEWDPVSTVCNLRKASMPKSGFFDNRYMFCQKFQYDGAANRTESSNRQNATEEASLPLLAAGNSSVSTEGQQQPGQPLPLPVSSQVDADANVVPSAQQAPAASAGAGEGAGAGARPQAIAQAEAAAAAGPHEHEHVPMRPRSALTTLDPQVPEAAPVGSP